MKQLLKYFASASKNANFFSSFCCCILYRFGLVWCLFPNLRQQKRCQYVSNSRSHQHTLFFANTYIYFMAMKSISMPIIISTAAYFANAYTYEGEKEEKKSPRKQRNEQQNPFHLNALILYEDDDDNHIGAHMLPHIFVFHLAVAMKSFSYAMHATSLLVADMIHISREPPFFTHSYILASCMCVCAMIWFFNAVKARVVRLNERRVYT